MKKILSSLIVLAYLATFIAAPAYAGPQLLGVDSGSVTSDTNGAVTNATASDRSVSNWDFDIASHETFNLAQPSSQAVALFRDFTGDASHIFGALNANGNLFLINTSGVLFGPTAQVNVGGLVASTMDMSNKDFLAGNYVFQGNAANPGYILNQGNITAQDGGYVALLGGAVRNEGTITANQGSINLAAGNQATLYADAQGLVQVAVTSAIIDGPRDLNGNIIPDAIANAGKLQADGGLIKLTARAVEKAFDKAINHEGISEARSISVRDGKIILDGGDAGIVSVTGTLDASGKNAGETGGTVQVLGDKVGLFSGAKIDASGDQGGGTVLIGGDFQGSGPEIRNASYTYVDPSAVIQADALTDGDGGKIIVWADQITRYYGSISARGGAISGDGGFVEVSGKEQLDFHGIVDTSSPTGLVGSLLLDPRFVVIDNSGSGSALTAADAFGDPPGGGTVTIDVDTLNAAVANVTLRANSDITVANMDGTAKDVSIAAVGVTLTMQAGRDIIINDNVATNNGTITLVANETLANGVVDAQRLAGAADITLADGKTINAGSADISILLSTAAGLSSTTSGDITLENLTTTGNILVRNNGPTAGSDILRTSADALISGGTVALDVDGAGLGGAIGTAAAPIRVSAANLEAESQSAGIFITTIGGSTIGGAVLGALTGAQIIGAAGIIDIRASSPLTINDIVDSNGGAITLAATGVTAADDLTINADVSADGGVIILAAGDTLSLNTGVDVTTTGAGTITASAGDNFTGAGNVFNDGSGAGAILMANGSTLTTADTAITLDAQTSISLDTVNSNSNGGAATGDISINARGGSITDNSVAETANVIGDDLTLTATGDIGGATAALDLDTTANTLNVSSTVAGNIFINESDGVNLLDIDTADGLISITTGGATTITDVASLTNSDANDITLTASTGNISLFLVNAGASGDVTVTASSGNITDGHADGNTGATTTNVTADDLVLSATTGIGATAERIEIDAQNLEASGGSGGVFITDKLSGLIIGGIGAMTGVSATGSDIAIMTLSPLTVNEDVVNSGGGNITLLADNAAATDDLTINANVTATGGTGAITLIAGDTVSFSFTSTVSAASTGVVTVRGGDDPGEPPSLPGGFDGNSGGNVLMADGAVIQSEDGDITLAARNNISLGRVNANSDGDGAVGNVTLAIENAATGGSITDNTALDTIANITGNTVTMDARTGVGTAGAAGDIDTTATTLNVSVTGVGDIYIAETDGVTLTDIDTVNGLILINTGGATTITDVQSLTDNDANDISIIASTGAVSVNLVSAQTAGDVTISTGLGAITDADADGNSVAAGDNNITADDLVLIATAGIGATANRLETTVADLEASGGSGGVFINDIAGGLTISDLNATIVGVSATGAGIFILANSPLTVNQAVSLSGATNDITLVANGATGADDLAINANVTNLTGGNILLVGGDDVTFGAVTVAASVTGDVNVYSGEDFTDGLHVHPALPNGSATGDILMNAGTTIQSEDGDVLLDAHNNIELATVDTDSDNDSTAGSVTTIAHLGSIINAPGFGGVAITATNYAASSVGGFGTDGSPLSTDIRNLELEVTGTTGGIFIRNIGTLNIGNASALFTGIDMTNAANAFDVEIFSTSTYTITERVEHLGTGNIELASTGTADTNDLTIRTAADGPQAGDIFASGGNIVLAAGDTVTIEATRKVETTGTRTITVAGGENYTDETITPAAGIKDGNAAGEVNMAATAEIATDEGNVLVDAASTVRLGLIDTDDNADTTRGDVTIYSRSSSIQDNNGGSNNITADFLEMRSNTDIGASGVGNRLNTTVNNLEARAGNAFGLGGAGGVFIDNTNAAGLIIGGVTASLAGILATNSIEIFSASPLTITENVSDTAGGNITLSANGVALTDDLTLMSGADVTSINGNGTVILSAGDDVIINNGSVISTTGTGTVTIAAGENFADVTFNQNGNTDGSITMGTFGSATGEVDTEDGNITLDAANFIEVAVLNGNSDLDPSLGDVLMYARRGSITDANAATLNITGDAGDFRADDGIGAAGNRIETALNNLEATGGNAFGFGGTGGVYIDNTNPTGTFTIGGVTGALTGVMANSLAGDIEIFTDGALVVASGETVTQTGGGDITLASTGTSPTDTVTLNANVAASGGSGDITITAGNTLTFGSGVSVSALGAGDIILAAGEDFADGILDIIAGAGDGNASGDIVMASNASVLSADGTAQLRARENIDVAVVNVDSNTDNTAGANIFLEAETGAITDVNNSTLNITGDELAMTAASGIASAANPLELFVNNVAATGGTGGVFLRQDNLLLTVGAVGALPGTGITAAGEDIEVITSGVAGAITVVDPISNTGGFDILLAATGTNAANDVIINDNVSATGGNGNIQIFATDTVTIDSGGFPATVSTVGTGTIRIHSGENFANSIIDLDGLTTGDIFMGSTGAVTSQNGSRIIFDSADDMTVAVINADSDAGGVVGDVLLYARRGDILDSNDGVPGTLNITGDELEIKSDDGVGASGLAGRIETDVNNLEVLVGDPFGVGNSAAAGGVFIENIGGALTLGGVTGFTDAFSGSPLNGIQATGAIEIFTSGAAATLTVNEIVRTTGTNGGSIILGSKGATASHDLLVNANVTSLAGAGALLFVAGDSVVFASGATGSTTGAGTITVLAGHDFSMGGEAADQDGSVGGDIIMNDGSSLLTPDGNITLNARDSVSLSTVNANSDAAGVVGDVDIDATGGSVTDSTAAEAANIIGDELFIDAATGIGTAGAGDVDTTVATMDLTTTSGAAGSNIFMGETDGVTLTDLDTVNGSISVTAGGAVVVTDVATSTDTDANDITITTTAGNIDIGLIDAGSASGLGLRAADVFVQTGAGSINELPFDGADDVIGDDLSLLATAGIAIAANRIETRVSNLEATGGSAGVHISNTGALTIGLIGPTVGVSTGGGDIFIITLSPMTVAEDVVNSGGGNITLVADGGGSGDTMTVNAAVNVTASGGNGDVLLISGGTFSQGAGSIVSAAGTGDINIGTGEVFNEGADPPFERNGDAAADINMADGAIMRTSDGDVLLSTPDSVVLGEVNADFNGDLPAGTSNITIISPGGSVTDGTAAETPNLIGNLIMIDAATGVGAGVTGAGDIDTTGVTFDVDVTGLGVVHIGETDGATLTNITTANGPITFTAGGALTVTNVVSTTDADGNDIAITTTAGSIGVDNVSAGGAAGDVFIQTLLGAITDLDAGATNIFADDLTLLATTGVASSADIFEVQAQNLEGAGGTGGFFVCDVTGSLDIGSAAATVQGLGGGAVTGINVTGSDIEVYTVGALTISELVTNTGGGNIFLATKGGAAGNDTFVNANVIASGGNGNIIVAAGDDLTMADGAIVCAAGTGQVDIAAGEDYGTDETLDQDGSITGDITMGPTATAASEDGDVNLIAPNNILLGIVNADKDGDGLRGNSAIEATNGTILDSNVEALNVTANTLTFTAFGNIGTAADPIEVDVFTLNTFITGGGTAFIDQGAAGDIFLDNIIVAFGDFNLIAGGTITVNSIHTPNGNVSLNAGDNIFSSGSGNNNINSLGNTLIAGGVIGTAEAALIMAVNGGYIHFAAGRQMNELSVHMNGDAGRDVPQFLNVPPGLVIYNNHLLGGGNIMSLEKSQSILYLDDFLNYLNFGGLDGKISSYASIFNEDMFRALSVPGLEYLEPEDEGSIAKKK